MKKLTNKYEIRWSNGFWKVFDTVRYTSAVLCHTHAEAKAVLTKISGAK
jgi:hypothetical protein